MFFFDEENETAVSEYSEQTFDSIKHINEYGQEYWLARELQSVLEYSQWRYLKEAISRAEIACRNSGYDPADHFAEVRKMVHIGSGAQREVQDIMLSRYACYLIVMNGDPRKEVISLGQTYFAIKTRQQEIVDNQPEISEDQKRLAIRSEMKRHNSSLADAAHDAGISKPTEYAVFQNYGYQGLYGGLKAKDIANRKGLKKGQNILDHMGSTELAANLFRATQTEEKLRREQIVGKANANKAHYDVGKKVRQTIQELGGTMPENLPTPEKSIQQLEREQQKKQLK